MDKYRKSAIIVGIMFIIGTVAGILSVAFTGPLRETNYLVEVSKNGNGVTFGILMVLTMGLALTMIPAVLYPLFKKYNETLTLGYVIFRSALEAVTYLATILCMLVTLTLSKAYIQAGMPQTGIYETTGVVLQGAESWVNVIRIIVFSISALMLNTILYRTRLIPRWLALWGLFGAVLHLANGLLAMFGIVDSMSTLATIIDMPIALQEMIFAVWLIVKGFNTEAIASLQANQD